MPASPTAWPPLDRTAGDLEGQLYRTMRDRILLGRMTPGQRLPSTRALAAALRVARSTVVHAYERLKAEGYVQSRTGSASRVATLTAPPSPPSREPPGPSPAPSRPAEEPVAGGLFEPGVPDLTGFPHAAWARCLGARARALRLHDLGYGGASGLRELQEAILDHISAVRGVVARPEQLLIVPSTRIAIDLLARLRLRPGRPGGDVAWIEEPGYPAARILLQAAGARLLPVPCDEAGIDVAGVAGSPPRLIYTTPSHQYPTGATMSLPRRLALLELAQASGTLVLEDDYDSDFQPGSRPIAALQGIDRGEVVAYLGTFSKVLAPGLRVAYAVVPPRLVVEASAAQRLGGAAVPVHVQAALADFIRDGHLRAHLRRMNATYAARRAATAAALRDHCGHALQVAPSSGGLQLAAWFRDPRTDDRAVASALNAQGFALHPMSSFHLGPPRPGLLFGIARMAADKADDAAARIGRLLDGLGGRQD